MAGARSSAYEGTQTINDDYVLLFWRLLLLHYVLLRTKR